MTAKAQRVAHGRLHRRVQRRARHVIQIARGVGPVSYTHLMKKLAAMLAACGILLSLAGCGDKDKTFTGKAYEKEIMTPGEIVVGISADYPPYESMGTDGKVEGFDVDMANELAKYMGAEGKDVKVTFKNMDFSSIITALQSGQIDVGISAFTYDPERDCLFSDPYLISEQLVVLPKGSTVKSLDELSGKKIGAGTGTTGEKAAKENISGAEVTSPGDYLSLIHI